MQQKFFELGLRSASILSVSAPFLALAQTPLPPGKDIGTVLQIFCTLANWAFTFLVVLAVIFVVWAAFNYLTAAGDPEKVKAASHRLIYAAVAIAVAILARSVPLIVGTIVGGAVFQCT